jgi:hypothetical protein
VYSFNLLLSGYFGSPIFSFLGIFSETFLICIIYLLFESFYDLLVRKLSEKSHYVSYLKTPMVESHMIEIILFTLLPFIITFNHSMVYCLVTDPPELRIISFFSIVVPLIFG